MCLNFLCLADIDCVFRLIVKMRILRLFTNMFFLVFFFFICLTDIVCGRRMVIMRIRSPGVSLSTTVLTAPASLGRSSEYSVDDSQWTNLFVCPVNYCFFFQFVLLLFVCSFVCCLRMLVHFVPGTQPCVPTEPSSTRSCSSVTGGTR